ncbi:hypothetical protein BHM03_00027310 [Ensete ventricosum]|nr:hypothetical protein BHM03_00027310 [Ensete ventricosum]
MIRSMVSPESHFKAQLNPPYSRHSGEGRCVPLVPDVGTHLIETLIPSLARGQAPDRRRPWPPHLALSFDLSLGRSLLLDLALLCCFVLLMLPSSVVDGVVVAGVSAQAVSAAGGEVACLVSPLLAIREKVFLVIDRAATGDRAGDALAEVPGATSGGLEEVAQLTRIILPEVASTSPELDQDKDLSPNKKEMTSENAQPHEESPRTQGLGEVLSVPLGLRSRHGGMSRPSKSERTYMQGYLGFTSKGPKSLLRAPKGHWRSKEMPLSRARRPMGTIR